ncbi:hypothetical protein BHE74_00028326 [Ensete ventricosum]|nr:hypothetical protein GW17_00061034 [Ensete ventricosum]RWW64442.1 hypothetical protein BHE74_00028326 [Ensete ventricosum]
MAPKKRRGSGSKTEEQPVSASPQRPVDDVSAAAEGIRKMTLDIPHSLKQEMHFLRCNMPSIFSAIHMLYGMAEEDKDEKVMETIIRTLTNLDSLLFGCSSTMRKLTREIRRQQRTDGGGASGSAEAGGPTST